MRIADLIARKGSAVLTVPPDAPVSHLLEVLAERNVGAAVVCEGDRLAGIVSERDVVRHLHRRGAGLLDAPVSEIMTTVVATCRLEDDVQTLSRTMTERRIRHIPVVDDQERLTGIVSIGDVVKTRIDQLEEHRDQLEAYISG
ncbi:CBS domain-containing protein [Actinomycetospora callitridis]|uniref:CBS domain-containing protein n=1 Tax=Actinomycetospora callitridis TaxID=913944 RepID=UPI0023661957|nr:CBS domain-containing protein [Actinomycetospora callitridis]MDD7921066.1 CBS domain-containing protein [Actinomycetospora callitridis]